MTGLESLKLAFLKFNLKFNSASSGIIKLQTHQEHLQLPQGWRIAHFADMVAILNSIVLNIYYGMLRGQINMYLPPEHPNNKIQKWSLHVRNGLCSAISCPAWWGICRLSHAMKTNPYLHVYPKVRGVGGLLWLVHNGIRSGTKANTRHGQLLNLLGRHRSQCWVSVSIGFGFLFDRRSIRNWSEYFPSTTEHSKAKLGKFQLSTLNCSTSTSQSM